MLSQDAVLPAVVLAQEGFESWVFVREFLFTKSFLLISHQMRTRLLQML